MFLSTSKYYKKMENFLDDSITESYKKTDRLRQIKDTLDNNKGLIQRQQERIMYLYDSLIENHQDTETIKYVKARLQYSTSNYNGTSLNDIYKDYIYWCKINYPTRDGFKKDKRYSDTLGKKDFNKFLNSIFKPSNYGREETYIAYTGVSIKYSISMEMGLEDELDGTVN